VPKGKEIIKMEQEAKMLYLFQTTISLWVLALGFMVLIWAWTSLSHQEPRILKRPGLNLKEL
jgi:hypothetical protein